MKDSIAIQVKNLTKKFRLPLSRKVTVQSYFTNPFEKVEMRELSPLRGISFSVKRWEFFSIIGPNGAGKSTLLKIIAGIYQQDGGSVTINGTLVPFLELGVGFTPELTAYENVYLNGVLLGLSRKEIHEHLDEIFGFAGLDDFRDVPVKNFSSGMQVRLAFSVAIKVPSDILVLDEVLAVGDAEFQQKCYKYFDECKGSKTIVFVSHDLEKVKKYSNRVLYLRSKNDYEIGEPGKMIKKYEDEVL